MRADGAQAGAGRPGKAGARPAAGQVGSGGSPARRAKPPVGAAPAGAADAGRFLRAENEDDDGYDPYSDRPAPREPLFERDPWS